jgi:hypothetical protein
MFEMRLTGHRERIVETSRRGYPGCEVETVTLDEGAMILRESDAQSTFTASVNFSTSGGTPIAAVSTSRFCLPQFSPCGCAAPFMYQRWKKRTLHSTAATVESCGIGRDCSNQ